LLVGLTKRLLEEVRFVRLVARDERTPRAAKWLAGGLIAYALSPIDLIPDFIPVIGHLDDAVVLPLGLWLLNRMIPATVKHDCRRGARTKLRMD
jgi:uncharacterized membrane protein YkvA (DUF1232 family)